MKTYLILIASVVLFLTLNSCAPMTWPAREPVTLPLPELPKGKSRVYFFTGAETKSSPLGFSYQMPMDYFSCRIFIDNKEISYVNHDDIIVVDLPKKTHKISWQKSRNSRAPKKAFVEIPFTLEVNKNEKVFLEMNMRDVVEPGLLKLIPLKGWKMYIEEKSQMREIDLIEKKVVGYFDLD